MTGKLGGTGNKPFLILAEIGGTGNRNFKFWWKRVIVVLTYPTPFRLINCFLKITIKLIIILVLVGYIIITIYYSIILLNNTIS